VIPDDPEPAPGSEAPVELPIEDAIDLHAFAPRDVVSVVDEYLRAAVARGFVEVRIVHGRGIGVQRQAVRRLLEGHPLVAGFRDAPPERGGWGATLVVLKPPR
jgi:DNA-nicking Smr family endonuclease